MNRAHIHTELKARYGTYHRAAQVMGVREQVLRNLTGHGSTRATQGQNIRLGTALTVLGGLWPEVSLHDLVGRSDLVLVPDGAKARRRLKGYAETS